MPSPAIAWENLALFTVPVVFRSKRLSLLPPGAARFSLATASPPIGSHSPSLSCKLLPPFPLEGCANVYVSAYNSPRDFSITGPSLHVQGVGHILLKHGATISPVAIDGPWHSSLADAAARETAELLRGFEISRPRIPVCLATSGVFQTDCQLMRESLSSQITAAVRWSDSLDTLWRAGGCVRSTLEVGPGRVLTSFLRANWTQREYIAQFLDRPGGRAFNFASLRAQPPVPLQTLATKENNWSKTA